MALLILLGQAAGLAHGPSLRDGAEPGHIPGQAARQQTPQNRSGGWRSSVPPTLSPAIVFFSLGFKGYLLPFRLGPLARGGESGQPTAGVSTADKHQGKAGSEEATGERRGGRWQRDMEVYHGRRMTFVHNIVDGLSAPLMHEQKGLTGHQIAVIFPYSARLFFYFQRETVNGRLNQRDKQSRGFSGAV